MKNPTRVLLLSTLFALVALVPTAAAMDVPGYGEVDAGWNWGFSLLVVGLLAVAASFLPPVRAMLKKIPIAGSMIAGPQAIAFGIVILLAGSFVAPGGLDFGDDTAAAASAGDADTATFADGLYQETSDVTLTAADYEDKTALGSVAVKLYPTGDAVTEKAAYEGSATPEYSGTMSSGSLTINGIQVQVHGCEWDVHLSISGYYEQVERGVNICTEKNLLGNNDVNVPTFYMKDFGTMSLASTATTLTCTAGTQCTYSIVIKNTEDDSWVHRPAVKYLDTDATNDPTLDSIDAGDCEIVDVSGTIYVQFNDDLGPLEFATCAVKITRPTGDTDGTFSLTLDDLFKFPTDGPSTAWNTNSNILGGTATSATTVTFA